MEGLEKFGLKSYLETSWYHLIQEMVEWFVENKVIWQIQPIFQFINHS